MSPRLPLVQGFLDQLHPLLRTHSSLPSQPAAAASIGKIFSALTQVAPCGSGERTRRPACAHLASALAFASTTQPTLAPVCQALAALQPLLTWYSRQGGSLASENFSEGHANAMIVGPGGLEQRHDVWIGVSLMAPHVRYPDHTHPPEETYLVLSPGQFRQLDGPWLEPGVGGLLHTPPGITHAMRSGARPLLALWWVFAGLIPSPPRSCQLLM